MQSPKTTVSMKGDTGSSVINSPRQFMVIISSLKGVWFFQMHGMQSSTCTIRSHLDKSCTLVGQCFMTRKYSVQILKNSDPSGSSWLGSLTQAALPLVLEDGTVVLFEQTVDVILNTLLYGRICPGRHLAEDIIFIVVASILKTYTISLAKDAKGNEIPVVPGFSSGFISSVFPSYNNC